jgi:hypothetical protein
MQCYRANTEKVVWRVMDGEAVLVHADTSAYYGLNATATCIWEALASRAVTREDIGRRLSARYGGAADAFRTDVEAFLVAAEKESLVLAAQAFSDAPTDELRGSERRGRESLYEPPSLSRFGELEKLVLSGE